MLTHPLFLYLIVAVALLNPRIARGVDADARGQSSDIRIPLSNSK
jgi:hypothetical protein